MRGVFILYLFSLAAASPRKLSSKFLSTPMARGGGRIVGGTEASPGEFPHQIMLLRGGVGGSLMCGGSLVAPDRVITAGHCCDGWVVQLFALSVYIKIFCLDNPLADWESELELTSCLEMERILLLPELSTTRVGLAALGP